MASEGSIRVVSKRKGGIAADPDEVVIDIDRTNPALGNPHILHNHNDPVERATVIAARALDVEDDLARSGPIFQALQLIAKKVEAGERVALQCSPRPCHGDQYAEIVARMAGIELKEKPPAEIQQFSLFDLQG